VALGRIKDSRAIGPLLETLKTDNWHLYKDTFKAVQKFGAASVLAIAGALSDAGADANQRVHLIDLLGAIGHTDALEPLVAMLHDANAVVRLHAACALGMLGSARVVEPLIGALADTSVQVQSMAARALGQLGDTRVVGPLLRLLRDHELYGTYTDLYRAITLALQALCGMPKQFGHSVRADFTLLSDEDALALKRAMINQIEDLSNIIMVGGNKAAELLNLGRSLIQGVDEARSAAPQQVDMLITWLSDASVLTRVAAAVSLPWYSDARALEPLRIAEHDPDPGVQTAAAWAAGTLEKLLIYRQQRGRR
jgi:HEAT repeat protein